MVDEARTSGVSRRGFLGSVLALGAAPAIVRVSNLMPLWVPKHAGLTLEMLRKARQQLIDNAINPAIVWGYNEYDMSIVGRMQRGEMHWIARASAMSFDDPRARAMVEAHLRSISV